ncbi:hypothetical protein NLU66_16605 [Brachybacterium sp. NBEC-018]|uniref:hypothetical protein n=1 Tax=Brachybacterium sp. NBEC-018 TaxID=2996004 RepID=UPI0021754A72|nr:hypothetical protein [Brachybacterium sp. NBEC-018]UVY83809.1 hypothetical protein NLU66_16605 [Brachybacterium sp. NBEC-018]
MAIPTSPWNTIDAQGLGYLHVGHKIRISADEDHVISGVLEELRITRERYFDGHEIKRKPAMVKIVVSFGDVMTSLDLRGNDRVEIKP